MQIAFAVHQLNFRHAFRIAHGTRTGTPVVYVRLSHNGMEGYGEATLPPYLAETTESVIAFLRNTNLSGLHPIHRLDECLAQIHREEGHSFARCALEEALFHLAGQLDRPFRSKTECTYTIGLTDSTAELQEKLENAQSFGILKLKIPSQNDRDSVLRFRELSSLPFCVDANQGWTDLQCAIDFSHWLKEQGAILIEQAFGKDDLDLHARFLEESPLPSIADESIQNLNDLRHRHSYFSGVNVKLLKCGGPLEAEAMLRFAKEKNMFRLIGCMSESSLGCAHAARLWKYADLLDLDGPFLISNDPFSGYSLKNGKVSVHAITLNTPLHFTEL